MNTSEAQRLAKQADDHWDQGRPERISDDHRRALQWLGEHREWFREIAEDGRARMSSLLDEMKVAMKPFIEGRHCDGPGNCEFCGREMIHGIRHFAARVAGESCWVGTADDPVEPDLEPDEEEYEPAIPTHRCTCCGEYYYEDDPLFDGLAVRATSRWMLSGSAMMHLCCGYGVAPKVAVEVDIWA
jgi:hypothetical protein